MWQVNQTPIIIPPKQMIIYKGKDIMKSVTYVNSNTFNNIAKNEHCHFISQDKSVYDPVY